MTASFASCDLVTGHSSLLMNFLILPSCFRHCSPLSPKVHTRTRALDPATRLCAQPSGNHTSVARIALCALPDAASSHQECTLRCLRRDIQGRHLSFA